MRYLDLNHVPPTQPDLRPQKGRRFPRWFKFGLLTLFLSAFVYGGYVLFWPASATLSDIFKAPAAVLSFIRPTEEGLKSTNGRTNILLVGIDKRSYESYNGSSCFRSDTMIVASIDMSSKEKDVILISAPRDLWVSLPKWSYGKNNSLTFYSQGAKVNAAYCHGDQYSYTSGGGLGLARDSLQTVLGIPIHYAARIDFEGFKKMIDAVGGISVNVDTAFTDCEYPIEGQEDNPIEARRYKCISFKKGYQYMDAEMALEFVRSRHGTNGEGSDLARAKRQQKILTAIRDKALSLPTLADPLKMSALLKSFDQTVQTLDVDFSQVGQFYKLAQSINAATAQSIVLGNDSKEESGLLTVGSSELYGGAFVFVPRLGDGNFTEIQAYIRRKLAEASLKAATSSATQR